jgi:hypothetical protein
MCHKCLLSMGMLSAYTHSSPTFPTSILSSLIYTSLSSYRDPVAVTSLTYLLANRIHTPLFLAALGLSQLRYSGVASRIQLAYPGISLKPRFSRALPLSLCSCSIIMSTLGVREFRNLLFFAMFSGLLRPRILCVTSIPLHNVEKKPIIKHLPRIYIPNPRSPLPSHEHMLP